MISKTSERRMAENEVYFRNHNEKLQKAIDEVNTMAKEHDYPLLDLDPETKLAFYCECSNEDCTERVELSLNEYKQIHRRRDTFCIRKGHEVGSIEEITAKKSDFYVVTKNVPLPATVDKLNVTAL